MPPNLTRGSTHLMPSPLTPFLFFFFFLADFEAQPYPRVPGRRLSPRDVHGGRQHTGGEKQTRDAWMRVRMEQITAIYLLKHKFTNTIDTKAIRSFANPSQRHSRVLRVMQQIHITIGDHRWTAVVIGRGGGIHHWAGRGGGGGEGPDILKNASLRLTFCALVDETNFSFRIYIRTRTHRLHCSFFACLLCRFFPFQGYRIPAPRAGYHGGLLRGERGRERHQGVLQPGLPAAGGDDGQRVSAHHGTQRPEGDDPASHDVRSHGHRRDWKGDRPCESISYPMGFLFFAVLPPSLLPAVRLPLSLSVSLSAYCMYPSRSISARVSTYLHLPLHSFLLPFPCSGPFFRPSFFKSLRFLPLLKYILLTFVLLFMSCSAASILFSPCCSTLTHSTRSRVSRNHASFLVSRSCCFFFVLIPVSISRRATSRTCCPTAPCRPCRGERRA